MSRLIILDLAAWRRRWSGGAPPAVRIAAAFLAVSVLAAALAVQSLGARADQAAPVERLVQRHQALSELAASLAGTSRSLRRGDQGLPVSRLQQALWEVMAEPAAVDGVFGPATERAVKNFQARAGLAVDGVAGRQTLTALAQALEALMPRPHTVARGETLAAIARRFGVSMAALAAVNGIENPDRIQAGAVLWIPDPETEAQVLASAAVEPRPEPGSPAPPPGGDGSGQAEPPASGEPAADAAPAPGDQAEDAGDDPAATGTAGTQDAPIPPSPAPGQPSRPGGPVALTFNDGPDPSVTPRLLDLLDEHGIPATFFFSGAAARQHPDLVRRAAAAGHEIANHGWDDQILVGTTVQASMKAIQQAQTVLSELSGTPPKLFRPQGAVWDAASLTAARRVGLDLVLWTNIGAEDLPGVDAATLGRRLAQTVYPGAIIMLHADNAVAVEVLEQVLPGWVAGGAQFLTLTELLQRGAAPTPF